MKYCKYCETEKEESEFYSYGGHRCKGCCIKKSKKYYRNNPNYFKEKCLIWRRNNSDKLKIYAKKYRDKCKDKQRIYYRKWYAEKGRKRKADYAECIKSWLEAHPMAKNVRAEIATATRTGKLIRPKICSSCNEERKVQAHHPDYKKPLEIIWLCASCHKLLHNNLKNNSKKMKIKLDAD